MTAPVILVQSHHGAVPTLFAAAIAAGTLEVVAERALTANRLRAARGLIVTMHLDQVGFLPLRPAVDALLDAGGRVVFNGQAQRPLADGLGLFTALPERRRDDLALTVLADHPVFDGVDRRALETRRGVAGFYGRGHNRPPPGARLLTGVGRDRVPLDWAWSRQAGGTLFSHAGNDAWTNADDPAANRRLAANMVAWAAGETEA